MKKLLLSVIALLLVCGAVSAQEKIQWGIKAGVNRAMEHDGNANTKARPNAFYGGLFMEVPMDRTSSIQPELIYSMQGGRTMVGNTYPISYIDKFDYINVPVIIKIYLVQRSLNLDFGPQFGYLISAKVKTKSHNSWTTTTNLRNYIDNKFDVALGLGFTYKLGNTLDISLRYNYSLVKPVVNLENRYRVIQLGIGTRF